MKEFKIIKTLKQPDINILFEIEKLGYVEFRDGLFDEEYYKTRLDAMELEKEKERFRKRNPFTYEQINTLESFGLIKDVEMSWHTTYELTDLGVEVFLNIKEDNYEIEI